MPIYEYRCKKCGDLIEKIQKFSDPPLSKHEGCGGKLEIVLSSPAIQFKGSGFYITDYARKSSGSGGESSGSSDGGSKSSESASKGADGGSKGSDSGSKSTTSESTKSPAPASKKESSG
ncbi:MAG TPA: FmdB family zinc ribbon protein [Terriglobia bacterium]|nr:FmdB family zinc ribbon protein [Terriglobia bacterium]